jgi:multicomponent Na+:H+ antiporter subunit G
MVDVIAAVLLAVGATLAVVAAVGLHRFPDVFARMHAASKPATLGLVLILAAAALRLEERGDLAKIGLVVAFQFLTAPLSAHMVGRSAYRAGTELSPETEIDDLSTADAEDTTASRRRRARDTGVTDPRAGSDSEHQ